MPVSKKYLKWHSFMASELGVPEDALWVENNQLSGDLSKRTHVFIWTEKLSKQQLNKITSFASGGSAVSRRGKLFRTLNELNSDGWLTSVKPSEATLGDLHPISPLVSREMCLCGEGFSTSTEKRLGKCYKHLPNKSED